MIQQTQKDLQAGLDIRHEGSLDVAEHLAHRVGGDLLLNGLGAADVKDIFDIEIAVVNVDVVVLENQGRFCGAITSSDLCN